MVPAVTQEPWPCRSINVDDGRVVASRPAATTTRVPVVGWTRGAAHRTTTAITATRAAAIHRTLGLELQRGRVDGASAPMRPIFGLSSCAARLRIDNALAALLVASPESGPPGSRNLSSPVPAGARQGITCAGGLPYLTATRSM